MRTLMLVSAVLISLTPAAGAEPPLTVYTNQTRLRLVAADGAPILEISPYAWGPRWAASGVSEAFEPAGDGVRGTFTRTLAGTAAPMTFDIAIAPDGPRRVILDAAFSVGKDADLTAAIMTLRLLDAVRGPGRADIQTADGARTLDVPLGRGPLTEAASAVVLRDDAGRAYTLRFAQPARLAQDRDLRIILAQSALKAGDVRRVSMTLELPEDAAMILIPGRAPAPAEAGDWFEWEATGDTTTDSVIDMRSWLEAPAGKHGRVTRRNDQLIYNGRPIKFWGINLCYNSTLPPRDIADRKARFYAKYGINAVRFHKFMDGPGGGSVLTDTSAVQFDPAKLDNMDYLVAQLKGQGIYVKLSTNFGRFPLGPDDASRVPYAEEFPARRNNKAWREVPQGALWYADEIAQLQIEQLANVLKHKNPHTGLRYADDPAIMVVELVNENSAFFFSQNAMKASPAIKQRAGEKFFAWLRKQYKTEEALLAAWGPDALNSFTSEKMTGEGWDKGLIYPVGNPWYFDPARLEGMLKSRRRRLLDTMAFLYELQNAFYDRFVQAIRDTGYEGEILASNWQAGRAYSHYLNLHSDARIGIVDRHNYFSGKDSMLAVPGGGVLSSGMQQVADRPFMLSEWIHVFPNEFAVEGPAIIGAYGMGLNGWDVSYMFQNRDNGTFHDRLGTSSWDAVAPQVIGVFPAVARQVHRGDVRESDTVFSRNVHIPSVRQGELGFDDRVTYDYDVKQFDSQTIPAATLAIGRSVVTFTDRPTPTRAADLGRYTSDGMLRAATGQLAWRPGDSPRDGHLTINTPGTQAAVGFASGRTVDLDQVTITSHTPFAAIYVTALEPDAYLAGGKRWLITTLARVHNTDMKYVEGDLVSPGTAPMRVEPVVVDLVLKRAGAPTIHILDHDGRRTGRTITPTPAPGSDGLRITLDGRKTHAVYYEVVYP